MNKDKSKNHVYIKARKLELIVSLSAMVIGICALGTTIFQTRILNQQKNATVWPRLSMYHGYIPNDFFELKLTNYGVGPGILKSYIIIYDGKTYDQIDDVVFEISKKKKFENAWIVDYKEAEKETVISPQVEIPVLSIKNEFSNVIYDEFINNLFISLEFESIYGERWKITYPKNTYEKID
ncbi:hypothetical protein [Aureivirga sp. CE67]|uniref:hypothetical protein n=1 Tax=Aureivirga sp. CE67 TaxID=1788983 RepID=UPI0018C9C61C|nr:hypothetical protein [Aureivirga sp. CE67]